MNPNRHSDPFHRLLAGDARLVVQQEENGCFQRRVEPRLDEVLLLPGAFNPLHDGHRQMASLAQQLHAKPVAFEISVKNVDKATLARDELERRSEQFSGSTLCLTQAATFVEKCQLFPASIFLVGADTIFRIGQQRYYDGAAGEAFELLAAQRCRFLVFGRVIAGRFQSLDDLEIPSQLRELCDPIAEETFRADVSSTELREKDAGSDKA